MSAFTPLTGAPCTCRRGVQRDNCPACEGTGKQIDFGAIHAARRERELAAVLEADAGPTVAQVARAVAALKCPSCGATNRPPEPSLTLDGSNAQCLECAHEWPTVAQVAALILCPHGAETPCYLCRMSDGVQVDR